MSDADRAYELAKAKIAEVSLTHSVGIDFSGGEYRALDRIPPEIDELGWLQSLTLRNTQITDLAPLAGLTGLRSLNLSNTQITELATLAGITRLQSLWLSSTRILDLAPLVRMTGLRILDLSGTLVTDLAPLAGMTGLQSLYLHNTQITDLAPLVRMTGLQSLTLSNTPITDLAPLKGMTELQRLTLSKSQITDLAPLAGLSGLQSLYLQNTKITDLAPLAMLKGLRELWIDSTSITDLRPVAGLKMLGTSLLSDTEQTVSMTVFRGLIFENTLATQRDAQLDQLAKESHNQERTLRTLEYLRSLPPWPEPYTPAATPDGSPPQPIGGIPTPPEQDPALPLTWDGDGFDFQADSIASDAVTEAALEDLRDLLDVLRRKGNAHDDLYRIAGELQERSAGEVSDLNMVKLHLSYQKLRRLHKGRATRENPFDDETVSHMEAVFDILPGVTLADENVHTLIQRQEAERAADLSAREDELSAKLLEEAQHPDAPFKPVVKDIAGEVLKEGVDDRLSGARRILSRNVVIVTLKFLGHASATGIVGNFAYNNGPDILAYASTMGSDVFFWAQSVMAKFRAEYELAMGITREVVASPKVRPTMPKPEK